MGTTPVPLTLDVAPELADTPELAALVAQGHTVRPVFTDADMILHPRAWRLLPEHMKFLSLAMKEARAYARAARPKAKKARVKKEEK